MFTNYMLMSEIDVTKTEQCSYLKCDNDVFSESFESHVDPIFKSDFHDLNQYNEGPKRAWMLWSNAF